MVSSLNTFILTDSGTLFSTLLGYGHTFVSAMLVLGTLVFVHELGHFLVALKMGVGVEKFSLGFGPKIFGKKNREN